MTIPKLTLWLFALFSARLSHHSDGVLRENFVPQSMFRFDKFIITISGIIVNTARDNLSLEIVMLLIYQCIYFSQAKKTAYSGKRTEMDGAMSGIGAKKITLPGGRSETPGLLLIVNRQGLYRFKKKS